MNHHLAILKINLEEGKITEKQVLKVLEDYRRKDGPVEMTEDQIKRSFYLKKLGII